MADESIIIEVKDAVDSSISAKIRSIAQESRSAQKDLNSLQRQINGLNFNSIRTLSTTAVSAAAAINKLTASQSVLAAAQTKAAIGAAQVSSAQEKAARASLQAATAAQQLATENNKTAKSQIDAQVSAMRLVAAQDRLKKSTENVANKNKELQTGVDKNAKSFERAGLSVKQYNASMRGVPAQITDIVVSLQGGQAPLTVLLQQGGQLKDMFGGIGPAARALSAALLSMINPFTVVAAAVGVFLFTVGKVESSLRELNGLAAQFSATGRGDIDNSFIVQLRKELALLPGVSKAAATEVIAEFAKIRDVGATNFKLAAGTVADLATALGTDAPKAAKILAESFKDPVKGAIDLDEKLGFLTVENFKTIKSLQDLGKTAEAQKFLIDKLKEAIGGLATDALTPMQKASNDLGNAWNKFTGELSNTGPIKAVNEFLTNLLNRLTDILNTLSNYKIPPWLEKMFSGGLNGMVADLVKGKTENTGGATGSWDAPTRTAAQTRSTKSKTDAAGITGPKTNTNKADKAFNDGINAQIEALRGAQKVKELIARQTVDRVTSEYNRGMITELAAINNIAEADKAALQSAIVTAQGELELANKKANNKKEIANLSSKVAEAQEKYNARELAQGYSVLELDYKIAAEKTKFYNESARITIAELADLEAKNKATKLEIESMGLIGQALANLTDKRYAEIIAKQQEKIAVMELFSASNENIAQIQLETDKLNQLVIAKELAYKVNTTTSNESRLIGLNAEIMAMTSLNSLTDQQVVKVNQLGLEAANLRLQMGGTDPFDAMLVSLGKLTEGYSGLLSGLGEGYGNFFKSLEDGFANSVGRAIVYSENLGDALRSVAQSAVSELISSLVKLGIQYAANALLGNTIAATATASQTAISVAAAATTATAWAPAAAMVSLASFGANSVPAMAGIGATTALTESLALASLVGFKTGGYTGNGGINEPAGTVHGKEFVFDAAATSRIGVSNLQALQDGSTSVAANSKVVGVPTGNQNGSNSSNGQQSASNNIRVVNVLDPALIGDFLATPAGEQVFMNTIRKNSSGIKQTIQNG